MAGARGLNSPDTSGLSAMGCFDMLSAVLPKAGLLDLQSDLQTGLLWQFDPLACVLLASSHWLQYPIAVRAAAVAVVIVVHAL